MPNNNVYQLDATQLRAWIFGQTPAGTVQGAKMTIDGALLVSNIAAFSEIADSLLATSVWGSSSLFTTATMTTYTFAVYNPSDASEISVALQISPDNVNWVPDTTTQAVATGQTVAFEAERLLKYTRVRYAMTGGATLGSAEIDIWLDSQS